MGIGMSSILRGVAGASDPCIRKGHSPASQSVHPLELGVFGDPQRYKVAVVGIGAGAGASLAAACLAWRMGRLVDGASYLASEAGPPAAGESASRTAGPSILQNINWDLKEPEPAVNSGRHPAACPGNQRTVAAGRVPSDYMPPLSSHLPPLSERPLWEQVRGRYIIVGEPEIERLAESSIVICIVDPLPSRVQSGAELASAIKENRIKIGRKLSPLLNLPTPVLWVINKDNEKVNHRLLERFLGVTFDFRLPLLDSRLFYAAEYSQQSITDELAAAAGKGDKAATEFIDELDKIAKKILASLP